MPEKMELLSLTPDELTEWVKQQGQGAFRARQIYEWLMRGADFDEMTNLSLALRRELAEKAVAMPLRIREVHTSQLDGTEKYLYEMLDGNLIEGVLMRYKYGATLCLSTQIGCRMGCAFCASKLEGCVRNLTPGEMLAQVLAANRRIAETDPEGRVHNIVLMGSGEPLDNYDNVVKLLRLVNEERGLHISLRNISLSTCGLVPKIDRLAEEHLPVTLSISLHAPNDAVRKQLMPVANAYAMDDLLQAVRRYIQKTGRRVIFEYALVKGVNCAVEQADELANRLRGMQCHVNLIPLNDVEERQLHPPTKKEVELFMKRLEQRHISVTRRREMGDDIQGACGQLRRHALENTDD